MDPITTILVDDEQSSLENLEQKIRQFCPELKIIAAVEHPTEAIFLIRHHNPDVIFLDIEMPHMNGFRMLNELGDYSAEIIFTTAYNHYSIEALRLSAFGLPSQPGRGWNLSSSAMSSGSNPTPTTPGSFLHPAPPCSSQSN
jgi:two-component system, LytTR family, response regulator